MCGLAGMFLVERSGRDETESQLSRSISHRGPDGSGRYQSPDAKCILVHSRLAILDLTSRASQPMTSQSGNHVLAFNGEIYNYRELREHLSSKGIQVSGGGDTEVLLELLELYGMDGLRLVNGMFALALYDQKNSRLFLARDQHGIKPLFYKKLEQGGIVFASEANSVAKATKTKELSQSYFREYFTYQYSFSPESGFSGVNNVMPGQVISFDSGPATTISNWHSEKLKWEKSIDPQEAKLILRESLGIAASLQTRSDVPISCYLSGGLDSSVVSTLAARSSNANAPHTAFTGYFAGHPEETFDERVFSRDQANFAGLNLREVEIEMESFDNLFDDLVKTLDYPLAGPGSFPQYVISSKVAKDYKVVLGGQGGDELFGGYARHSIAMLSKIFFSAFSGDLEGEFGEWNLRDFLSGLSVISNYRPLAYGQIAKNEASDLDVIYSLIDRSKDLQGAVKIDFLDSISLKRNLNDTLESFGEVSIIEKFTLLEQRGLLPALLHVEDRVSMAWGLEARVPLLDKNVTETLQKIPPEIRFSSPAAKSLLRDATDDLLSERVRSRTTKMGFPVPLNDFLATRKGQKFLNQRIDNLAEQNVAFLDRKKILSLKDNSSTAFSRGTWALLNFESWMRQNDIKS